MDIASSFLNMEVAIILLLFFIFKEIANVMSVYLSSVVRKLSLTVAAGLFIFSKNDTTTVVAWLTLMKAR